jgi:hypothetical protein
MANTASNRPGAGGTFDGACCTILNGSTALPANQWTHLAGTYDGAQLRLYLDGVQVASQARTGTLEVNARPLRIGGNSYVGESFPGLVDEVRMYNRALSPTEIAQDMATPIVPMAPDRDHDGVSDSADNCPFVANADQRDTGGIGATSSPDGVGDACQCGDVSGNGRVTAADAVLITRALLVPPTATLTRSDLCNVGGTAACTAADSVIVTRALLLPPTANVAQECAPALP